MAEDTRTPFDHVMVAAGVYIHAGHQTILHEEFFILSSDKTLKAGHHISSPNGKIALVMQKDGNLMLYKHKKCGKYEALWDTWHKGGASKKMNNAQDNNCKLIMQTDGNLVLYTSKGNAV
eukprot:549795_1